MKNHIFSFFNNHLKSVLVASCILMILTTVTHTYQQAYSDQQKIPSWVRNVVKWWGEGQVSDDEFLSGMKFLIQNNIMIINLPSNTNSSSAMAGAISGPPSIQTDKTTYNASDEIKISGSGFEKGDVVIVVGNMDYLSLLDNYTKSLDWSQTDFSELSVLLQYQYSDNGNETWQKSSYPVGFAIISKVHADSAGNWQTVLKNYQMYEKNQNGNYITKTYQLPHDQYIIKAAQKIYSKNDSSYTGYRTLLVKTAYSNIAVQ